jgi:hypothetical protein
MLKRRLLLASALAGMELTVSMGGAQAGGMGGFHMPSMNTSNFKCPDIGGRFGGHMGNRGGGVNVYSPTTITNNINRATNINVNKRLNVYSPVNVTTNIDRSSNINAQVNIDNSRSIDMSSNVSVNKEINVRTTNIFNGRGSSPDHWQGGQWGSHSGGGNWGGGGSHGGGGSSNSGNNNNNGNNNGNENNNSNDNSSNNWNHNSQTVNNSNSIDASGAIDSFFDGLRGWQ